MEKSPNNELYVNLAGHTIALNLNSRLLADFFSGYKDGSGRAAEFVVTVENKRVNGIPYRETEPSRFFLVHKSISDFLITKQVLTVHASSLVFNGKAYLFAALSGTGKSTHTRLWREAFGERVTMISDDQPLVRIDESGVFACGSPWNGKEGLGSNIEAPIGGICLLSRGETDSIRSIGGAEAMLALSPNVYIPPEPELTPAAFELLRQLVCAVPCYRLSCGMAKEAALFAMRHIVENRI